MEFEQIKEQIEREHISVFHFNFIDPTGIMRTKSVLAEEILRTLHISLADGVSINGGLLPGYPERSKWYRVVPETDTFRILPSQSGQDRQAFMLSSISNTCFDSRRILRELMNRAAGMGLFPMSGLGFTYGLPDTAAEEGNDIYRLLPGSPISRFNIALVQDLKRTGIDVESFHAYSPTHNGIELVPQGVTKGVDQLLLCRWIAASKALEARQRIVFTLPEATASPIHMSVWNMDHNQNLFFDPDGKMEYSGLAYQFIAGVLCHFDEIFAVIGASAGLEPQAELTCDFSNSSLDSVLGTPEFFVEKEKKSRVGWSKRCVFRGMMMESNLYLSFAAIYLAGLDGIRAKLRPADWRDSTYTTRSKTTRERCEMLAQSELYREFFGENVIRWLCSQAKEM